jgi:hypothetical protein
MAAYQATICGANRILSGALLNYNGSDGGALATLRGTWGGCGAARCGHRPIQKSQQCKKPATGFPARAYFLRCWTYAGDLPDVSNPFESVVRTRHPRPGIRLRKIGWELRANYRIDIRRNFSMLIAMTDAGQTQRQLDEPPTQTLNFLDCRLKTANVLRPGLPIPLIPHIEELHGRN